MKLNSFTLAEVLVTLGIIGVVAALTMPTLIHNYRKSVVENKLKSEYSLIFNAIRMAEAKNGTSDNWETCDTQYGYSYECTKSFFDSYLAPELKFIKVCELSNREECWTAPNSLSGKKGWLSTDSFDTTLTAILSNGSSLFLWAGSQNADSAHLQIWFDIDGPTKGKNTIGVDVFGAIFFFKNSNGKKAGLYMYGNSVLTNNENIFKNDIEYGCSISSNTMYSGMYCGALIQRNGWKIPKDYPYAF